MKFLSNIQSEDLNERFADKLNTYHTFSAITTTSDVTPDSNNGGAVYLIDSSIAVTLIHSGLPAGERVIFVSGSGANSITTADSAYPSNTIELSTGDSIEAIWSGSQWIFHGKYTP